MVQRIPWFFLVILLSGSVAASGQEERETCLISLAGEEVSCSISIQQRFHLGDNDRAFEWLNIACEEHAVVLSDPPMNVQFDSYAPILQ